MTNPTHILITVATIVTIFSFCVSTAQAQNLSPDGNPQVNVHIDTAEADSILTLLTKRENGQPITDDDWKRLFSTRGYIRLKERETAMKRSFEDADFKTFVMSEELLKRRAELAATLAKWTQTNVNQVSQLPLAYLPTESHIHATIYPVIKPRTNSFVFDIAKDPAIFLYLDPSISKEKFENTLAHELHHIGYGSSCPTKETGDEIARLPQPAQDVLNWIGAFGEGFAMLAAAGGPDMHPHAVSPPEERQRWDHDVANFNDDLKKVQTFFQAILDGKLSIEEKDSTGFSFFGIQGPWYIVGWKIAAVIEKTYGRARLIECICDQRKLLSTYNAAVTEYNRLHHESLATWSPVLLDAIADKKADKH